MNQESNPLGNPEPKKESSFARFFSGKGFYIVLILCLCAIGVSGYLFIKNSGESQNVMDDGGVLDAADGYIEPVEESLRDADADLYIQQEEPLMAADPADEQAEDVMGQQSLDERAQADAQAAADSIVIWPLSGEINKAHSVDALSYSETMADWRVHSGTDIAAEAGTKVMAIMAGTVSQIYEDDFLGTTVVIEHADNVSSLYANLMETPTVNTGDSVSAGDVIGAVGQTALGEVGQSPHLHLEIYKNGQPVDPAEFLP